MVFQKKIIPNLEPAFGEYVEPVPAEKPYMTEQETAEAAAIEVQTRPIDAAFNEDVILPRFQKGMMEKNSDLRVVLFGYGVVSPDYVGFVDDYTFIGGVCRNVPVRVAQAWAKGKRWQDNKPASSRIYPQAILRNEATDADFVKATGIVPMAPSKLAAMIGATDADALVKAMGKQQAIAFAEKLRESVAK